MCDPGNDSLPSTSIAYAVCESLTSPAARELYELTNEYNYKVFKIISDPQNKGSILVILGSLMNIIKGREHLK